ncbi:hypothetical protein ILUMI_15060 [Ignelater luminosus]|uniref:Uncharacterized protein n=1 Tax=Ignelater luminosus TaxID=2038154 RepID=A0A8K0CPA9_IGNLU|nr:hypothetical protein ILUMI_15060 [Ignelater luminosus]
MTKPIFNPILSQNFYLKCRGDTSELQSIACQLIFNMKSVAVFLFALLVGALGYNWDHEELECVDEQKLDKAEIEELNDPWEKPTPEDNKVLNDLLECSWKTLGMLNDNGEINWDKILENVGEEIKKNIEQDHSDSGIRTSIVTAGMFQGAVNECREQGFHGSTPGQTAAKAQNCVGEKLGAGISI